jgi:hypothetical protein
VNSRSIVEHNVVERQQDSFFLRDIRRLLDGIAEEMGMIIVIFVRVDVCREESYIGSRWVLSLWASSDNVLRFLMTIFFLFCLRAVSNLLSLSSLCPL